MSLSTKIILAGEGGQGIQTIAKIIAQSAASAGFEVSYIPSFGVEQRGTPSVAFIIISREKIYYPRFDTADYAVILQKRAIETVAGYIDEKTKLVFDSSTIDEKDLPDSTNHLFGLPATKFASESLKPKVFNIIIAGKLASLLNLDQVKVWSVIESVLGKKFATNAEIRELNQKAFELGSRAVFEITDFSEPKYQPSSGKIVFSGHGKKGQISPERCKGCGICIFKCPVGALRFSDTLGVFATPVPEVDLEKCIACGNCLRFCPDGAIMIEKVKEK